MNYIENTREFYFKTNNYINKTLDGDDDYNNNSENKSTITRHLTQYSNSDLKQSNCQIKIDEFNFITVYLFEDFYLNQFNNVSYV